MSPCRILVLACGVALCGCPSGSESAGGAGSAPDSSPESLRSPHETFRACAAADGFDAWMSFHSREARAHVEADIERALERGRTRAEVMALWRRTDDAASAYEYELIDAERGEAEATLTYAMTPKEGSDLAGEPGLQVVVFVKEDGEWKIHEIVVKPGARVPSDR